jgi:Anaphase promoting complex (APC) subunit 2
LYVPSLSCTRKMTCLSDIPVPMTMEASSPQSREASDRDQQHWQVRYLLSCTVHQIDSFQYIKTMLTNFGGGLSTSTIYNMLKYAPERKSSEQLEALLKRLEADNLIEGIEGVWRLV